MKYKLITLFMAKSMRLLLTAALVALLVASINPPSAAYAAVSNNPDSMIKPNRTITIEVLIDGKSQLILEGNTAQWHHIDFAAPGRHLWVDEPTTINGVEWYPIWPDEPDTENYSCDCYSSTYKGIKPALPHADMTVSVNVLQGRGEVNIVEASGDEKNSTVIVEFNDNPYGSAEVYKVELTITYGGKP